MCLMMEKKLSIALVLALTLMVASVAVVTTQEVNADTRSDRCNTVVNAQIAASTNPDRIAALEAYRTANC